MGTEDFQGAIEKYRRFGQPGYKGKTKCSPESWEFFMKDYLRPESPTPQSCYGRLERIAGKKGWIIPSLNSLIARLDREVGPENVVLIRTGKEIGSQKGIHQGEPKEEEFYKEEDKKLQEARNLYEDILFDNTGLAALGVLFGSVNMEEGFGNDADDLSIGTQKLIDIFLEHQQRKLDLLHDKICETQELLAARAKDQKEKK